MKFPEPELEKIKKQLLEEKLKIIESLASLKEQDPYSDVDRLSDNAASDTEAKEESSHERMEALEKELNRKLSDINEAFARIEAGTYGVCIVCGQVIDAERLHINPTAHTCVTCQEKQSTA
jgi:RNA polymerase-binding transcription factor DksA